MATYRVTCHTPDNSDPDYRIQGLGGTGPGGGWWNTIDRIIAMIRNDDVFYVMVREQVVLVVVKQHPRSGRYYLTTQGDGFPANNLLNLPHCPYA